MKREHAEELIEAWKVDGLTVALSCREELKERYGYLAQYHVRPLLSARNKLASDALWDGRFDIAKRILIRTGLTRRDNETHASYKDEAHERGRKDVQRMKMNDLARRGFAQFKENSTSAWNVIKGPRRRRTRA